MFTRKVFLITLFSLSSMVGLMAQNLIHVHGTVTNENGDPEDSVNILISAFFADSSFVFESLYTETDGTYDISIPSAGMNIFGSVDVIMVDCAGTTVLQHFVVILGNEDFQADFTYCVTNPIDSCTVIIIEEWNPGSPYQLVAWTPPGLDASFVWSTGDTTNSIYPMSSGTYCVEATFPWGCTSTDCIDVFLDSTGNCFAYIISSQNPDDSYNLDAIALGIAPFTFMWSTGDSTSSIINVPADIYCVTVTDSIGCAYTSCIILDDFNFCEVYIVETPSGGLSAEGFGPPPVTYLWNTGDSTQVIYPSEPGLYCVTMTDSVGCSANTCHLFLFPNDTCFVFVIPFVSDSNGFALEAFGYSTAMSWTYLWSNGDTTKIIYPEDPFQNHCVTMTDADGCVSSACYEFSNWCYSWIDIQYVDTTTAVLSVQIDPIFQIPGSVGVSYLWSNGDTSATITVTESGSYCISVTLGPDCISVSCIDVDFEALGSACSAWVVSYPGGSGQWYAEAIAWGFGSFEYLWSNGDTTPVTTLSFPNEYACVTVTSSFGCEAIACLDSLFLPCEAVISVSYASNNTAVLTAIAWNDPGQQAVYTWNTGITGPVITVTEEGTYCVSVMAGGCIFETCVDVIFSTDSCGVWISTAQHPAGTAYTANAWGTSPFTYAWSNGATEQTTVIDFGIHELCVTVTDGVGCIATGCNFVFDSCEVAISYTTLPNAQLIVSSNDPIATVFWSTGDTVSAIQVNDPGTYCATVTTIFGCVSTVCATIDSIMQGGGPNSISGYVYADTLASMQGHVYAYSLAGNTGLGFALIDSAQIGSDGYYLIKGLADGVYLVKAALTTGTEGALDYIPGYHYSTTTWENSNPHVLPNDLPVTTDVSLIRRTPLSGVGVIGGIVTDLQHITSGEHEDSRNLPGVARVVVLLRDQQGQPLDYAWTMEDGRFRFTGLPYGTYRLRFDIAGVTSPDIWVTLTPEVPERLQITLVVPKGTVSVEEPENKELILYPNPASYEIHIPLPELHTVFNVLLVDIQGKVVYQGSNQSLNGVLTLDVSSYTPGIYFVKLKSNHGLYHGRFMK